ncbi:MAG: M36 family metallopeptidase, partial [Planctomycetota bacterium]
QARGEAERASPGGRLVFDRTVLGAVLRMPGRPTVLEVREALLAADRSLTGGAHGRIIEASLAEHGIGKPPRPEPEDEPEEESSKEVTFRAPRKRNHVVHTGEQVEVAIEATSSSGAPVTIAAEPLARARLEARGSAPASATARFVYEPTTEDRGRHVVVVRATAGRETATRVLTFVVRKRQS